MDARTDVVTDEDIARLMALFRGHAGAHGTHGERTECNGLKWKINDSAKTVREPVTLDLWRRHVEGAQPLGIITISEAETTNHGSIDYDVYGKNSDIPTIVRRVDTLKLPLLPCYSKSGGLHLWHFTEDMIPASRMQAIMEH
jgi:hypothetical protein